MLEKEKQEAGNTEAPQTFEEIHAEAIREKVLAGLDRNQAVQVIRSQLAQDKWLKEQEDQARKKAEPEPKKRS